MTPKKLIILLISLFVIGFSSTWIIYSLFFAPQVGYLGVEFSVTDQRIAGLNGDRDAIKFGTIMQGNKGVRYVDIGYQKEGPAKVTIYILGEGKNWVAVSENDFVMKYGETKHLTFYLDVPGDASVGDYIGKAKVVFTPILFS